MADVMKQGGDTHFLFRFGLRTRDAYDPAAAMRFALEHQNPLVVGQVLGDGPFPETVYSLLTVSSPSALLWSLKPAEEGIERGLVARVWNLSDTPVVPSIAFSAGPAASAASLTHIETTTGAVPVAADGSLSVALEGHQMRTVLARLETSTPVASPTLRLLRIGSIVLLQWTGTGQACYRAIRSASPSMGGAQQVYQGPFQQTTESTPLPVGGITYYAVE